MIDNEIRIISLWQPWASLIALNLKQYETRSWGAPYRGKLAIHAAKRPIDSDGLHVIDKVWTLTQRPIGVTDYKYPLGCIVAIVDLTKSSRMMPDDGYADPVHEIRVGSISELERSVGNWQPGRYAWRLENICPIAKPIYYRGRQGLSIIREPLTLSAIEEQLAQTAEIEKQLQEKNIMISIEVRGFQQTDACEFVAIAPVWLHEFSRGYGEYPCNHFRFRGKMARYIDPIDHQHWNPENVFSDENWLEVNLYLIKWSFDSQTGMWGCSDHRSLNHYQWSTTQTLRFFLPRLQFRKFYEMGSRSPQPIEAHSTYNISHATCFN